MKLEILDGAGEVDERDWNALSSDAPFLEHAFLSSLEEAGTLGKKQGWIPKILVVKSGARVVAAAPAYIKLHSQGEFVFDFAFADLAQRMGLKYYPKLLVAVPFTPVTGPRLLTRPGEDRASLMRALGVGLVELARELGLSSVHVNFALTDEIAALCGLGFVERLGVQYHWYRDGASRFDEYLARFDSKKRNQIKREVRELSDQKIAIEVLRGSVLDDRALMRLAFQIYKSTVDKFYWGRQYLNEEVFRLFAKKMAHRMELVLARSSEGAPIAGAINFAGDTRLYGRYWGALEDRRFLHFNVCYYRGIEECLARKLDVFEPGAGGEHKLARGFTPTITKSAHWFLDARFGSVLKRHIDQESHALRSQGFVETGRSGTVAASGKSSV